MRRRDAATITSSRTRSSECSCPTDAATAAVSENGLFEPFIYTNDHFTKTGSGQTYSKHIEKLTKKRTVSPQASTPLDHSLEARCKETTSSTLPLSSQVTGRSGMAAAPCTTTRARAASRTQTTSSRARGIHGRMSARSVGSAQVRVGVRSTAPSMSPRTLSARTAPIRAACARRRVARSILALASLGMFGWHQAPRSRPLQRLSSRRLALATDTASWYRAWCVYAMMRGTSFFIKLKMMRCV
jgi:hypothetical protein